MMEEFEISWQKLVLIGIAALIIGSAYYVNYTESGGMWWKDFWSSQPATASAPANNSAELEELKAEIKALKAGNNTAGTKEKIEPNQDTLIDPPTLTVTDVQEKSVWVDLDGTALPEVIKVGSQVLYLQATSMSTEFGAIVLQNLVDSDDKFQKSFQSAKEESFSVYLRNSEPIWGDAVGQYADKDNKYVGYLVKISAGKYGLWYITPDTTSGSIPSNKDDLKTITPYNPAPAPETKPEVTDEVTPGDEKGYVALTTPVEAAENQQASAGQHGYVSQTP